MRDVMTSLREVVLATPSVMDVIAESDSPDLPPANERVFVGLIPANVVEASDTFHPPKMLVLRHAGGIAKADLTGIDQPTIDVVCYGEDHQQADRVRRAVWTRFVHLQRECVNDVLLHDLNPAGGPITSVASDTTWPAIAQSYTLTADVMDAA